MHKLGEFESRTKKKIITIDLDRLKIGSNNIGDFIIKIKKDQNVDYVINKVCDHAGGRLILKGEKAVCPMHGWELDLKTLEYQDSHMIKEKIDFEYLEPNLISFETMVDSHLVNPFCEKKADEGVIIRWLNHACIYIKFKGTSIITDPWLIGPAFLSGWWLQETSTKDSLELLKSADYLLISHNHPDHLHLETLSLVGKETNIIVGDFKSKSTENYLSANGFTNLHILEFKEIYEITNGFQLSILKSGDFRDDSGFYFSINGQQVLMTVDCNFLNSHKLPVNIDVLMTSFAGGASGFPLCYINYDGQEKLKILNRNRNAIKSTVLDYVKLTKPKYYMPYAGMFNEKAERDLDIKEVNIKNSVYDYENMMIKNGVKFIEPSKNTLLELKNHKIIKRTIDIEFLQKESISHYIDNYKKSFKYNIKSVFDYFRASGFAGAQILYIIPVDDKFDQINDDIVYINFKERVFEKVGYQEIMEFTEGYNTMQMYVRKEIISCLIENMLPWEDLSIGFQMRVKRSPNVYESDFWYHFTNVYINKEHIRYSPLCGSCTIVKQNPILNS